MFELQRCWLAEPLPQRASNCDMNFIPHCMDIHYVISIVSCGCERHLNEEKWFSQKE